MFRVLSAQFQRIVQNNKCRTTGRFYSWNFQFNNFTTTGSKNSSDFQVVQSCQYLLVSCYQEVTRLVGTGCYICWTFKFVLIVGFVGNLWSIHWLQLIFPQFVLYYASLWCMVQCVSPEMFHWNHELEELFIVNARGLLQFLRSTKF